MGMMTGERRRDVRGESAKDMSVLRRMAFTVCGGRDRSRPEKPVFEIVTGRTLVRMTWPKKLLLAGAAVCVVAAPVVLGQAKTAQHMMLAAIESAPKPFRAAGRAMIPEFGTPGSGELSEMQSVADPSAAPLPIYEYEAATIKPSKGPGPDKKIGMWAAPDGFSAWFITPQQIISIAYGVKSFQISGGPSWLPSERFDIEAKMDAATADALKKLSQDQRVLAQQQMLQALLASRFQLTVHRETKESTIYTLVIAKGGPKLQVAKPGDTYPNGGTFPDGTHAGAGSISGSQITGDLTAQAVPIARLVQSLTQMLGHPVSDKTGLKGVYDFKLRFAPDGRLQSPPGSTNERLPLPQADSNAPSLFDALQEQLGLKLVAAKGPVEAIVIDHIEKPASVDGAEVQPAAGVVPAAMVQEKAAQRGQSGAMPEWQKKAGGSLLFEVASIRPTPPEIDPSRPSEPPNFPISNDDSYTTGPNDSFIADFSLVTYIQFAYKLRLAPDQMKAMLASVPKWVSSDNYEIHAKASRPVTKDQLRLMMQSLLAERFKLALHFEDRDAPVLALTLVKPGKLGPNLRPHAEGPPCDRPDDRVFPAQCYVDAAKPTRDGLLMEGSRNNSMEVIAHMLTATGRLDHPLVDQTGLPGNYDFTIERSPTANATSAAGAAPEIQGATFLEALQEQLGLKITSAHAPLPFLIIDHVERPSAN